MPELQTPNSIDQQPTPEYAFSLSREEVWHPAIPNNLEDGQPSFTDAERLDALTVHALETAEAAHPQPSAVEQIEVQNLPANIVVDGVKVVGYRDDFELVG